MYPMASLPKVIWCFAVRQRRLLGRFLSLPPVDRSILLQAWFLLAAFRGVLPFLPFQTVTQAVNRAARLRKRKSTTNGEPEHVAWAITTASRRLPGATCLVQALAAQVLLARRGYHGSLRIGVRRNQEEGFVAHAWLEHEGKVMIGGPVESFHPLMTVKKASNCHDC